MVKEGTMSKERYEEWYASYFIVKKGPRKSKIIVEKDQTPKHDRSDAELISEGVAAVKREETDESESSLKKSIKNNSFC